MDKSKINNVVQSIFSNVHKVFVGNDEVIEMVILALFANGHVLIDDIPGIGKTTLVKAISKTLDLSFGRIQCTPDILPSDITGFTMYNVKTGEMEYKEGMVLKNIVLVDEINRASPKTQSSLLEIMEEFQVTVDGNTHKLPKPFMILATQNPVEYIGTFPLPEAQLDRFMLRLSIGYPNKEQELDILTTSSDNFTVNDLTPVVSANDILEIQNGVHNIHVSKAVKKYITDIIIATRTHPEVSLGGSPRASILLMKSAQALAMIRGKDHVSPDDIQYLAKHVLAHRLILKSDINKKVFKQDEIIVNIIQNTRVPLA